MLTDLNIQGFKSIHNIENLKLGKVNVFIGANGSGKSNLLEAMGVLGAAMDGTVDAKQILERGIRYSVPSLYITSLTSRDVSSFITFKISNKEQNVSSTYEVQLNNLARHPIDQWHFKEERLWRDNSKVVERKLEETTFILIQGIQPLIKQSRSPTIGTVGAYLHSSPILLGDIAVELSKLLQSYAIYSPTTPMLRGTQPDTFTRDPVGLFGGRLAEAVEELIDPEAETFGSIDLDDVLDLLDWVDGFDVTSPSRELLSPDVPSLRSVVRFQDYWMRDGRNKLSGYDANEGALYVLFMLVLALHPRTPRFFAIDNFDQSLHPRLARALMRLFSKIILESEPARQCLITTHNLAVLDGLDLSNEQIKLFAVERTRSTGGATQVYPIEVSDEILKETEKGLSLSNLWMMGRLGGVPNIF